MIQALNDPFASTSNATGYSKLPTIPALMAFCKPPAICYRSAHAISTTKPYATHSWKTWRYTGNLWNCTKKVKQRDSFFTPSAWITTLRVG